METNGSIGKNWDKDELVRCGATGTNITTQPTLKGPAHPIFTHWINTNPDLLLELEQPILLASKILETAGLPWVSDFLEPDIFAPDYAGREPTLHHEEEGITPPDCIIRQNRTTQTRETLRTDIAKCISWQLDENMFRARGWNGYTCRHPRDGRALDELDRYETIRAYDGVSCAGARDLTVLVMREFPGKLAELRRRGERGGEEWLITAFMAAVTLLHELGHAIYWQDKRALTRDLREPFYGGDLEMELGDSFVAALFGGWIPVPVCDVARLRRAFSFGEGVAWRQVLNWDWHRVRPLYRVHYSVPVGYIARLFDETSWTMTPARDTIALVRPRLLTGDDSVALRSVGMHVVLAETNEHATAAIADFHCDAEGNWVWNRRPGARFRIPRYEGRLDLERGFEAHVISERDAKEAWTSVRAVTMGGRDATTTTIRDGLAELRIRESMQGPPVTTTTKVPCSRKVPQSLRKVPMEIVSVVAPSQQTPRDRATVAKKDTPIPGTDTETDTAEKEDQDDVKISESCSPVMRSPVMFSNLSMTTPLSPLVVDQTPWQKDRSSILSQTMRWV